MRKLYRNLTKLSLLQQLGIIIIFFAAFIAIFFSIYLRGNIDDFVNNQCMTIIQRSQETIVANYKVNSQGHSELTYDSDVCHFIFKDGEMYSYYGEDSYEQLLLETVSQLISQQEGDWVEGTFDYSTDSYFYRYFVIDEDAVIFSYLSASYGQSIESALLSTLLNNSFMVISLLFFLLIIWVSSIIAPLQSIKNYIDKIRKGDETAVLKIDREDEIGEVSKALVDMRNEIRTQEETKEEMIHNISHDLKTPIAVIKSYAESIRDGIYPYDTLEASVDVIIENADRLEKKVYSLLYLNRLDYVMDQEKETDKTTDMNETMDSVIQSLKMIRSEVEIIQYQDEKVIFKGDEESWRVVISNLLDNALRYAKTRIVLELKPDCFTIFNDGPQIGDEYLKKMFKPFEKGDEGKFGLGLSICSKVCATYGYTIEAENMADGVIFTIQLKEDPNDKKKKK